MDERQEALEYLTGPVGVSPEEAERILADDDLFLTPPGTREGFAPEEAVRVWSEARERLFHIVEAQAEHDIFGKNFGVDMLLWDAASRAGELLRRAREASEDLTMLPLGRGYHGLGPLTMPYRWIA